MIGRISTHLLDTAAGTPAAGVSVVLEQFGADGRPLQFGSGVTDVDGRVGQLNREPVEAQPEPGSARGRPAVGLIEAAVVRDDWPAPAGVWDGVVALSDLRSRRSPAAAPAGPS